MIATPPLKSASRANEEIMSAGGIGLVDAHCEARVAALFHWHDDPAVEQRWFDPGDVIGGVGSGVDLA